MKKFISIDRIEGEFFVAEDETLATLNLRKEDFADPVSPGDCCFLGEDGKYHRSEDETEFRKRKNIELLKSLIQKD